MATRLRSAWKTSCCFCASAPYPSVSSQLPLIAAEGSSGSGGGGPPPVCVEAELLLLLLRSPSTSSQLPLLGTEASGDGTPSTRSS